MLKPKTTLKIATLLGALLVAPLALATTASAQVPGSRHEVASVADKDKGEHKHVWQKFTKKVWVAPVYQTKQVGTDKNGKPIYQKVLVRKGYYKDVIVMKCVKCGKIK